MINVNLAKKYWDNFSKSNTLTFLIFVAVTKPAYSYFDPGAITLFFQILLAGIVGGLVYIRFYSIKIIIFLKNSLRLKIKK